MQRRGRWLKRLVAAALGGTASVVIAACYGVYQCVRQRVVSGRVTYRQQGIPGIRVCGGGDCTTTDAQGNYALDLCADGLDRLELVFEDVDGEANGGLFLEQAVEVDIQSGSKENIDVELVPEAR